MQRNGFGALKCLHGRTYFLKTPTECFDEEVGSHSQIMKAAGINIHEYDRAFTDTTKMTEDDKALCQQHHPQVEILMQLNLI